MEKWIVCVRSFVRRAAVLATAIVIAVIQAIPVFASGNPWYDKYVSYESANGSLYYNRTGSDTLAWAESYMLRSYINMYENTKSTAWLDKLTTHVDAIIGNASDPDGDGYLGWTTSAYSAQKVANYSFATAASGDSTLPASWTRFQATSTTAYRSNAANEYFSSSSMTDTWGLVIKTNGTTWQKMYQTIPSYEPNRLTTMRFYGKTNGSAAKGRAYVLDSTTGTILASVVVDGTSWKSYSVQFNTPAAGHTLQVWLGHNDYTVTGGIVYYDGVKLSAELPYMVHDGMIGVPIAQFVRLVHQNPTVLSAYSAKAAAYRTFLEDEIVAKWHSGTSDMGNTWVSVSSTEGYYKEPTKFDSLPSGVWDPLPYNQYLVFSALQMILYDVNSNATYLDRAKRSVQYFKNRLTANGAGYTWKYALTSTATEDTSHGNLDIEAVVEMFNHAHTITGADMDKFTNTLTDTMWNGSTTSPLVYNYVNGTQGSQTAWTYTTTLSGWTKLAQFDATAWDIAAGQYDGTFTPSSFVHALVLSEIMKWDPVKLVNQGMELKSSADATLPARWTRFQSTSSTAYLDSANKSSGSYGVTIVSNGTSWQKLYQLWKGYVPSATYELAFDAKTDGSAAGGRVWVVNETAGTTIATLAVSGTTWQPHSLTFTAPANATDVVKIYVGHNSYTVSGGKAHFDNVVIKRQGDSW